MAAVGSETAAAAAAERVDWARMEAWDRAYYLHNVQAAGEHVWNGVAYQEGNYLHMVDGTRLLDCQSQLISDNMGHRHPRVVAGLREALDRYGHVYFGMATDYRARAAKLIVEDVLGADGWAGRVRILPSGSDAVDVALTMARVHTGRPVVLTQRHSFHGLTAGAGTRVRGYGNQLSSATVAHEVRDVPGGELPTFRTIPAPEPEDFDASGGLPSIEALERTIAEVGAQNVAAVVTETMLGVAGIMGHDGYVPAVRELTRRHGILWVDDEVICGFGRLGRWFSYQLYDGVVPDLMPIGKGMNGCILPVGGVVASKEIAEAFERDRWYSGSTWDGHPLVCATIVANVEAMIDEGAVEHGAEMGLRLRAGLEELRSRHPSIGRIGGRGLYHAVDLVGPDGSPIVPEDRAFDFTGDLSRTPTRIVAREAAAHGVFLTGFVPNTIKVAPPLTITSDEVDLTLEAFDAGLDEVERVHH
ncbi:MAG TPA: aspartate aminotransferase family protein [Gaiellaceae bacterium]|nr:aspartate aminotransferase family protein [Gaiellaceae bacterium]